MFKKAKEFLKKSFDSLVEYRVSKYEWQEEAKKERSKWTKSQKNSPN